VISWLRRVGPEEDGSAYAAVEMVLVLGIILLPLLAGIAQLPRWVDARAAADLAAQEAARQMVLADTWETGSGAGATVAREVVRNHGFPDSVLQAVTFEGELERGGTVTATVTLAVPPVILPGVGEVGGTILLTRSAVERVDDYRQFGPVAP
jgi:hypothetical protein